jgi:transposase
MARVNQLNQRSTVRLSRYFSEDFKKKKVAELDKKLTSVGEICKQYEVSHPAVYKWIYKYSLMKKKGVRMVVESESDTAKIKSLKQQIAELEQLLGQKQFEIEFLKKQMEIASDQYGVDLKKKPSGKRLPGTGNTESNTPTK